MNRNYPGIHCMAVWTTIVALLPIFVGALVTSMDAGMSVSGWWTSDGYFLFFFPWFSAAWDKFLEHGHRLAGVLVGIFSIGLMILCLRVRDSLIRSLGVAVLAAVILQGTLGGQRVLLDSRGLAFVHGVFASLVFGLMAIIAMLTSKTWNARDMESSSSQNWSASTKWWLLALSLAFVLQYTLGALVRHRGTVIHEHAGTACLVLSGSLLAAWKFRNNSPTSLKIWSTRLMILTLTQVFLGLLTFIARFGTGSTLLSPLEEIGISFSPSRGTLFETILRSSHVLVGMLSQMSSFLLTLIAFREDHRRLGVPHGQTELPLGIQGVG